MNNVSFGITSNEYMEFATPISASCVRCGIPVFPFHKGIHITSWGCGHCGKVIGLDNKKFRDLTLNIPTEEKI